MKRLLFVINQLYKGGAETSLVNLLNSLDDNKYKIELVILNQEPLNNAVSLIDRIDSKVKVCNAYEEYKKVTVIDRVRAKGLYSSNQKATYWFPALDFIRNKIYDWAFFVGEWCEPSFVATEVKALRKAAWIHSDISEAQYFKPDTYFYYHEYFDYYIFVSQNSLNSSVKKYPFIKEKAVTIYNITDEEYIKKKSKEEIKDFINTDNLPVLLTCANFRLEKNHLRQIAVMAELKRRGLEFYWLNIGATTDKQLVGDVKKACVKYELEDRFLILGAKENPYAYMKNVNAVTVLSDHESWSMVITEAKVLGIPVIATKTSGALEQIIDNVSGILTDFDIKSIADRIEVYLNDINLQKTITANISNFNNSGSILQSFDDLINSKIVVNNKKKILYVIDDINYISGAHVATINQINEFLKDEDKDIAIFTSTTPSCTIRKKMEGVKFLLWKDCSSNVIFNTGCLNCLLDKRLGTEEKKLRLKMTFESRFKRNTNVFDKYVLSNLSVVFSDFDIICVMAENSVFREVVSKVNCKKKIQWIHTDYRKWRKQTDWTKQITKNDGEIYKHFDSIVVLTNEIKDDIAKIYPHLKHKISVNKNILPVNEILMKAEQNTHNQNLVRFVSVGRFDRPKAYPRLINVLKKLYQEGYKFHWTIIGDGNEFSEVKNMIDDSGLNDYIELKGGMSNPFVEMKKADVFALLSEYEGLPNTIYEALILKLPVLATDVGGIPTQIRNGIDGWIIPNNEINIHNFIIYLLNNKAEIDNIKRNLTEYTYDNDSIMKINRDIFSYNH